MKRKGFYLSLCLLAAVTLCLLLMMRQQYPDTLSRLLTGRSQSAPAAVTVTSWPNSHENNFIIDDPTVLEQLWALMDDVPLVEQNITPAIIHSRAATAFLWTAAVRCSPTAFISIPPSAPIPHKPCLPSFRHCIRPMKRHSFTAPPKALCPLAKTRFNGKAIFKGGKNQ